MTNEDSERADGQRADGPGLAAGSSPERRFPEFYLIGAPKCGTTSIYSYLCEHPSVFMPQLKEPHFFAEDFKRYKKINSLEDYHSLFSDAPAEALWGEASVWYLYSGRAVAEILKRRPDAKFVAMLRNPVDAAAALHSEMLLSLTEDIQDFEKAWSLQEARAAGCGVPVHCHEPLHLQYRAVYRYAPQIRRLLDQVPPDRVKILIYEEFFKDPHAAYRELEDFLGLPHHERAGFDRINARQAPRSMILHRIFSRPPTPLRPLFRFAADLSYRYGLRLGRLAARLMRVGPSERPELSESFAEKLREEFSADIAELESLLRRPILAWRQAN